jgi:hypothetical protein
MKFSEWTTFDQNVRTKPFEQNRSNKTKPKESKNFDSEILQDLIFLLTEYIWIC